MPTFNKFVGKKKNAKKVLKKIEKLQKKGVIKIPAKKKTETSDAKPAVMQTANIVQLADAISEKFDIEVKAGDLRNFIEKAA